MEPQLGAGGGTPTPRKLRPASMVMTTGMSMEARMSSGPMRLGRMWTATMLGAPAPIDVSATMNSSMGIAIAWVRATRPRVGVEVTTTRKMMVGRLGQNTEDRKRAVQEKRGEGR